MASGQPEPALVAQAPEIDVLQLILRLWRRKLLLLILIVGCIGIGAVYLGNAQYKYTAELTVTPADQSSTKVPNSVASLGSLVGVDVGGQSGSAFAMFADTVLSYPTAVAIAQDQQIMRTIFSSQWDARTQQWRRPGSFVATLSKSARSLIGVPYEASIQPTAVDVRSYIREQVVITEDKKKSLVSFQYDHRDPVFAAAFLKKLVDASDNFLRVKSLDRSSTYILYLQRRINEVQVPEYRNLLTQSLVGYENKRMMASSEASFAADQFGDVWVSSKPTTPVPQLVLAISVSAALALWLIYVLVVEPVRATVGARRNAAAEAVPAARQGPQPGA